MGYFNLHCTDSSQSKTRVWFPRQVSTGMTSHQPRGQQAFSTKNTNDCRSLLPLTVRVPGKCFSFSIVEDGRKICIPFGIKESLSLCGQVSHNSHTKVKLLWCILPFLFTIRVIKFVFDAVTFALKKLATSVIAQH